MDLIRLEEFTKQLNHIHMCDTPGCKGELIPVHVNSAGQGGAVTIRYSCNSCISQTAVLETQSTSLAIPMKRASPCKLLSLLLVVHMTYYKVLKHALGIDAIHWYDFQSTIEMLYPAVKNDGRPNVGGCQG